MKVVSLVKRDGKIYQVSEVSVHDSVKYYKESFESFNFVWQTSINSYVSPNPLFG